MLCILCNRSCGEIYNTSIYDSAYPPSRWIVSVRLLLGFVSLSLPFLLVENSDLSMALVVMETHVSSKSTGIKKTFSKATSIPERTCAHEKNVLKIELPYYAHIAQCMSLYQLRKKNLFQLAYCMYKSVFQWPVTITFATVLCSFPRP